MTNRGAVRASKSHDASGVGAEEERHNCVRVCNPLRDECGTVLVIVDETMK